MDNYLHDLPIKALPGIGYVLEDKLKQCNVLTCGQLKMISKVSLYMCSSDYYVVVLSHIVHVKIYEELILKD